MKQNFGCLKMALKNKLGTGILDTLKWHLKIN